MEYVRYFPKGIFLSGNFQVPKGIFPNGNFINVQFHKWQLPQSVIAATRGPQPVLAAALDTLVRPI